MIRQLVGLVALLATLVAWDVWLTAREERARRESVRVGRLVPSEKAAELEKEAAWLQVRTGSSGTGWLFVPIQGAWRCFNYHHAPAAPGAIDGVYQKLLEAEGVEQSADPARFADYGIGTSATIHVSLHGRAALEQAPDGSARFVGDPLYQVELGLPIPGREGCYARIVGEPAVWAVDTSPLELLARADGRGDVPPLVDPYVVPGMWPAGGKRLDAVTVTRGDGASYRLLLRARPITEEEMRAGQSPWEWVIEREGVEEPANTGLAMQYHTFLFRAPWLDVLPIAVEEQIPFDEPLAVLTLTPPEEPPLELRIAERDGQVFALNPLTRCVYRLAPELVDLLAPQAETLAPSATESPWEPYLQQR